MTAVAACALGPACTTDAEAIIRRGQRRYAAASGRCAHRRCVTTLAGRLNNIRGQIPAEAFAVVAGALAHLAFGPDGVLEITLPSPLDTSVQSAGELVGAC